MKTKIRQIIFAGVLCSLLFVSCSGCPSDRSSRVTSKTKVPLPEEELQVYQTCNVDQDCVFDNNGCCDCANGGQEVAIHRDRISAYKARFNCAGVLCRTRGRRIPCGTGDVRCESGRCHFTLRSTREPTP